MSLAVFLRRLNGEASARDFDKVFAAREARYTFQGWYDHVRKDR